VSLTRVFLKIIQQGTSAAAAVNCSKNVIIVINRAQQF